MAYKNLFIDSDVLLDLFLKIDPFFSYAQLFFIECETKKFTLHSSVLVVANMNYILTKRTNKPTAKGIIKEVVKLIKVLPFESDIIELALANGVVDFEDAVQYNIANRYKCDAIITRNIKDYKQSVIPVLTPQHF